MSVTKKNGEDFQGWRLLFRRLEPAYRALKNLPGRHGRPVRRLENDGLVCRRLAPSQAAFNVRKRSGDYNPGANAIQIMTMKVSKGLECPVVALPGVGAYACGGGG